MEAPRFQAEADAVRRRYDRRSSDLGVSSVYHPLRLDRLLSRQCKERYIAVRLHQKWRTVASETRVLEVGCGFGANLNMLLGLGFEPENLHGIELLDDRCERARRLLPRACSILSGDAVCASFERGSFDIVIQSTVFSSILDPIVRSELTRKMWLWLKPGGDILWYDLAFGNPRNPDVTGISRREIRRLFPEASLEFKRITLAPPLGRRAIRIGGWLYRSLDCIPLLRSHTLAWGAKSAIASSDGQPAHDADGFSR